MGRRRCCRERARAKPWIIDAGEPSGAAAVEERATAAACSGRTAETGRCFCEQLGSGSAEARRAVAEALLASGTFPMDVAQNFLEHTDAQEPDQRLEASE